MIGRRTLLLVSGALAGCSLVDQRTFNPQAGVRPNFAPPPVPVAAAPESGPPPLFTVRLPIEGDLRADIARPVRAARARKAGVVFDVVELTPDNAAGGEAELVARAIIAQGVPPAQVRLAARPVPGGAREVRVYVR